jgi:translation initiation factor IF-3
LDKKKIINKPINEEIQSDYVLLVGEEGNKIKRLTLIEAIEKARNADLDLVEVGRDADKLPICKLMNYNKFVFQRTKQVTNKKNKSQTVKELQVGIFTGVNDLAIKINNAKALLEEGYRVKINLICKGREIIYRDRGIEILRKLQNNLAEVATVEHIKENDAGRILGYILFKSRKSNV